MGNAIKFIIIAISCVLLMFILNDQLNKTHDLSLANEQTKTVLADSIGELAKAMDTLAEANIKLAEVSDKQVQLLEIQHNDYKQYVERNTIRLERIIGAVLFILVAMLIIIILAYFTVKNQK
jgi:hypothetical protein